MVVFKYGERAERNESRVPVERTDASFKKRMEYDWLTPSADSMSESVSDLPTLQIGSCLHGRARDVSRTSSRRRSTWAYEGLV